jgi:AraC-like DNA-binding protein
MDSANQKTVLAVLYDVGFNSKSSFNTAFKKFTGMTPTEFKKSQINN